MKEKINYIKHLQLIHNRFVEDNRLSPWHISLYYALFHCWNHFKFQTPLSINRSEMMESAKIGSANTYLKCLKDLDAWGYIKYVPSKNPMKGSHVYLYKINTSSDTCGDTSSDTCGDTSGDTSPVLVLRPSINSNKLNKQLKTYKTIDEQSKRKKNKDVSSFKKLDNEEKSPVKNSTPKNVHSFPSSLQEVQVYFSEKKFPALEAEKFYNHFESNGWLVGGRSKMRNWKAAANNWMLNAVKFKSKNEEKPTYLHVNQDKDYSIPL